MDNPGRPAPSLTTMKGRTGHKPRMPVALRKRVRACRDYSTGRDDYTADEIEFMKAMDQYKRDNRRPFPSWSEVLEVLRSLGYRRVGPANGAEEE